MICATSRVGLSLALSAVSAVLCALPLGLHASVSSPVPERTGGFGEMTCQQCHWENPLNEPSGRLTLAGIPEAYTPGERYLITVTLARPALSRAGFQLSAREGGINMNAGSNAGSLRATDELAQAVTGEGAARRVTYLQHTEKGAAARSTGTARWTVEWIAPEVPDVPVVFHAAANAANDDASPLGDFIYTAAAASR